MNYTMITSIPNLCYPIDMIANINQIQADINTLLSKFNITRDEIINRCKFNIGWTMNLTHLPGLQGLSRPFEYTQRHKNIKNQNISETDFTEILHEIQDLYLGQLILDIRKYHAAPFQGRCQLVWLSSKQSYGLHKDFHTTNRYHLPIITNQQCKWHFRDDNKDYNLHMPADGRIWYVNPSMIDHDFINDSDEPRLHMILTSGI